MIKYIIKKLPLPLDVIDNIYSYIDLLSGIKEQKTIWFKRLITEDFYLYSLDDCSLTKYLLMNEETMLNILLKNNAQNIIRNIHYKNLKIKPN